MSYQVLARKYRPQKFADVIGQDHVTRTLMNALASGRIHHAYLFTGARGIGKTTVARLLAKALNCEGGPKAEPCGACPSCIEITEGTSLDVQEIDGASNTGVDDVREIRERVRYMPAGRYKIYVIDEVHMLSTSAFNALLKTLEEPPPHVVFIFATTESHKIPATILSRCQRYDFRRIPSAKIADSLGTVAKNEGISVDVEALGMIAREASGSLRDGQSLLDQAIAFAGTEVTADTLRELLGFLDREMIMRLLESMVARDASQALNVLDEIYQTGADLTQVANSVLEMLRHLLVIKVSGPLNAAVDLPHNDIEGLAKLGQGAGAEELERMFGIWYGGAEQIARSPFPKMMAEVLAIRMCNVAPVAKIADIVARIDELAGTAGRAVQPREVPQAVQAPARPVEKTASAQQAKPKASAPNDWEAFMRWLVGERPQVASVFGNGILTRFENDTAAIEFDAPIYADMVMEPDRKKQIDDLLMKFFKRPIAIKATSKEGGMGAASAASLKQQATKEALESTLVKQATEIFDAQVHEVRTRIKE